MGSLLRNVAAAMAARMLPEIDMRVLVRGTETGTVRFIGDTRFAQKDKLGNPIQPVKYAKGPWVGVELDEEFEGKNDGSVDGVRYFRCPTGRGIFVRFSMVRKAPLQNEPRARLRILTLNVRGWTSAHGHSSIWAVADLIKKVDADIVALCEVHDRQIKESDNLTPSHLGQNVLDFVAEQTGLIHHAFHSDGSQFGNALMSLFPFAAPPIAHELQSGSVIVIGDIKWHPEHPPVCVGATRLHHTNELIRSEQLQCVNEALQGASATSGSFVLLGSFNALHRPDYNPTEWLALEEDYQYHGFGDFEINPQGQALEQFMATGARDVFSEVGRGPMATYRWRDVRYDYIFVSPDMEHELLTCRRVDGDLSDHFALYVDIKLDQTEV